MFKILFFSTIIISISYSAHIATIIKGKIDKFENAYALVERSGQVISIENIGFKIKKKDKIKTFRRSNVKIKFTDNTVVKIGKKATFKIEEYIYNSKNKNKNALNLNFETGSFQIKTGKIGDHSPKNFKVKTKFSTIGLRG